MLDPFLFREVPALKKPVLRLGLSGSFGLDEAGAREALELVRYVFWTPTMKGLTPALKDALRRDRERYVVASGPLLGFTRGAVRRGAERRLRQLGTDYLDVYEQFSHVADSYSKRISLRLSGFTLFAACIGYSRLAGDLIPHCQ